MRLKVEYEDCKPAPMLVSLKMARKPSKQEFRQTVIVCGIGMFVLGAIGFVMLWLMDSAFPSFFDWLTN